MANIVDNLIAFRILSSLVTPFDKTKAFKLGVINADGKILIKTKDMTPEQKASYDMLDRLVFSLKRLLGKVPGGKSQISSLAAAYYLVKESYESGSPLNENRIKTVINIANEGIILAEEQLIVENFLRVFEEMGAGAVSGNMSANVIANKSGASVSTDIPTIKVGVKKKKTPMAIRSNAALIGK